MNETAEILSVQGTRVAKRAEAGDALAPEASVSTSGEVFRQAAALHEVGNFAEAEVLLRGAIARDPDNGDLRNARGVMFAALGRHLDALWCYRDALVCNP